MGCRIFRKRTDFTTTHTAPTEKMIVIFVSTLGKGRKYRRASDRWETSYLLRGGRALAVGTWYVEADFSFCGVTYFNPFVVVLFLGSRVPLGTMSWYQKRLIQWEKASSILMLELSWLINVQRLEELSIGWLWDCEGKQMWSLYYIARPTWCYK